MFEAAEVGHRLSKEEWDAQIPELRRKLLEAEYRLVEDPHAAVAVVVAGVDGAGKGDSINQLHAWMDTRHLRTHGLGLPTEEERRYPPMWRFWRRLPPRGQIGVFMGSWYTAPIIDRVFGRTDAAELDRQLDRIRRFERMLAHERVVLLKLWFHLSKEDQETRLKKLEGSKRTAWRVSKRDWDHFELYDTFKEVSAHALRRTSIDVAPWVIVPGAEPRYRQAMVGEALLGALERASRSPEPASAPAPIPTPPALDERTVLSALDLGQSLSKKKYTRELEELQGRLNRLTRKKRFRKKHSLVVVFEGMDASGKGGAIRRVTSALDARQYVVTPIAAPTDEEQAQPYLWRFWRMIPRHGKVAIFDRSWYGRVLVERVEGFASEAAWKRAYAEINDFEEELVEAGAVLVKLWLQIDPEEQLARFRERQAKPFKRYKITDEDWRNRDKWSAYARAASEMVERTSTEIAPWTLVPANDKRFARVAVLRAIDDALQAALE